MASGYCAFHDYTYPGLESGIYNRVTKGISYTNMPYALSINSSGANVCGENAVNGGAAGKLDGFSIVLGHEVAAGTTRSTPTRTPTSAPGSARASALPTSRP